MRRPRRDELLGALVGALTGFVGIAAIVLVDEWTRRRRQKRLLATLAPR